MKWFRLLAVCSVLACMSSAARGQEAAPAPAKRLSLDGVKWRGPAPSLEALKGKTVVLLIYATWCPICNKWSPEFFHQLHDAIQSKPVVVLAVNADSSPTDVQAYLGERGFFGPNIIHGYDPTIAARLGFQSELYDYVWIEPDGRVSKRGQAGSFYGTVDSKRFVLPTEISQRTDLGQFKILDPQMSPAVLAALWPVELGDLSEAAVKKAKTSLGAAQKAEVDTAVAKLLSAQLTEIRGLYKGSVAERLQAHEKAVALAKIFKQSESSKKAKAVVAFLETDKDFARELAAKKAYDACMQKSASTTPRARAAALHGIADRFEGTQYGELAKEAAAKKT